MSSENVKEAWPPPQEVRHGMLLPKDATFHNTTFSPERGRLLPNGNPRIPISGQTKHEYCDGSVEVSPESEFYEQWLPAVKISEKRIREVFKKGPVRD